jgi:uncharacterized membrane protein YhaH (DUF805 family)
VRSNLDIAVAAAVGVGNTVSDPMLCFLYAFAAVKRLHDIALLACALLLFELLLICKINVRMSLVILVLLFVFIFLLSRFLLFFLLLFFDSLLDFDFLL